MFDDIGDQSCTEFEIQAYVWSELRRLGYKVRGEYVFYDDNGKPRFADLAVFVHGSNSPFAIEVKADGKPITRDQLNRYRHANAGFCGIMVIFGISHAMKFIKTISAYDQSELSSELRLFGVKKLASKSKIMTGWNSKHKQIRFKEAKNGRTKAASSNTSIH